MRMGKRLKKRKGHPQGTLRRPPQCRPNYVAPATVVWKRLITANGRISLKPEWEVMYKLPRPLQCRPNYVPPKPKKPPESKNKKKCVGICVLVCRRAEFTKICFDRLIQNTDWSLVNEVIIVHDMPPVSQLHILPSKKIKITTQMEDIKCKNILKGKIRILKKRGTKVHYKEVNFGSVAKCQKYAMKTSTSKYFLKVDNDVAMGKGYLPKLLETMELYKELVVLGYGTDMTKSRKAVIRKNLNYGYVPCSLENCHVGGLVMVRMDEKVMASLKHLEEGQRFGGWCNFQRKYLCRLGAIGWYWPNIKNLVVIDRLTQKQLLIDLGLDYDKLVDLVILYYKNRWMKKDKNPLSTRALYYKKALQEIENREEWKVYLATWVKGYLNKLNKEILKHG